MQEQTQGPLEAALDVTQEYVDDVKNWHAYQVMTDTVVALDFENNTEHEEFFSDDQWELLNEYLKIWLVDDYSKDANNLMMSRMLRQPLAIMKSKVAEMLGKEVITEGVELTRDEADLKYFIYSAHDTQVVNMMHFLQKDFDFTPYASTVFFELKYSTECLASDSADENCFGVSVIFNGRPQLFDGCSGDLFTLEGCKFPEFIDYIDSVWYSGPSAPDLDAACSTVA